MKTGFVLPKGDARTAVEMAREAEAAGWDGFFVWEPVWGIDPWVSLAAAAMVTERIRLGTMLTPLPIRKPWKLAGETVTLDQLSGGRLILSVGLGAPDVGFADFGEPVDRKLRAELLDEGLAVLSGLWKGQPFNYEGEHYHVKENKFEFQPGPPVQQPRIPVWVVGAWPRMKSMRRVLEWDGLLPNKMNAKGEHEHAKPEDIRAMKEWIDANRTRTTPFDIVVEGKTPGGDPAKAAAEVRRWADAGATWWIEALWEEKDMDAVKKRVRQGPPVI